MRFLREKNSTVATKLCTYCLNSILAKHVESPILFYLFKWWKKLYFSVLSKAPPALATLVRDILTTLLFRILSERSRLKVIQNALQKVLLAKVFQLLEIYHLKTLKFVFNN